MSSRSSSYRRSRRPSPQPIAASDSRSRNQETIERRHQSTRGRSRSRSPRYERWASNPPGGWHARPRSGRSRMRSRTPPPRISRQRSSNCPHEDRHGPGEGRSRREARDRNSRSPPVRRRRAQRASGSTRRTRPRSSPPAETMRTRRTSGSLHLQATEVDRDILLGGNEAGRESMLTAEEVREVMRL
ncbi:hypothetical protein BKA70DRAFT_519690 [Coprinopsis sp. MPI-PUGE-AT-0042]|nr:hypothetical protein BKA70DRAFT_519690 [Coprinopsis sp. MPI-PUGE-AT-0042]